MPLYELTTRKTKDTNQDLQLEDFNGNILEAVKKYSKVRPRIKAEDILGPGGHDFQLPASWSPGLSTIQTVEYPIGKVPESYIDNAKVRLYQAPDGLKLRLYDVAPLAGQSFRVTFTALHDEASLPESDIEAVANLAASLCCRQLAQRYAGTSDPTIGADVVNYRSKGDEFARRAKELRALFQDALGIKENDTTAAAMATVKAPARKRLLN